MKTKILSVKSTTGQRFHNMEVVFLQDLFLWAVIGWQYDMAEEVVQFP